VAEIEVLIVDGETAGEWHRWRETTPVLVKLLSETGLFRVAVRTLVASDPVDATTLDLDGYDVVVLNYDAPDERWDLGAKRAFLDFAARGGGVVVYHGANNGFPGWDDYNDLIGLGGWRGRDESAGVYCYVDDGGKVVRDDPGPTGSHGRRVPFAVATRDAAHPVMSGLPELWMHHADELYGHLRGPRAAVERMCILATAYSPGSNDGTERDEPVLMASTWGEGRVFHTTLGHDVLAMSCVGFATTFQRGVEWAATGSVAQAVPEAFPTAGLVLYRPDVAELDPVYPAGLNPLDGNRWDT
jgi:hypothetical protein